MMAITTLLSRLYDKFKRHFAIKTWEFWEIFGFHVSPNHFYWPIPDSKQLRKYDFDSLFVQDGIRIDDQLCLEWLDRFKRFKHEYQAVFTRQSPSNCSRITVETATAASCIRW